MFFGEAVSPVRSKVSERQYRLTAIAVAGAWFPCLNTRAGRCPVHPGSTRVSCLPGGSADAATAVPERCFTALYLPHGKASYHQTAPRASA